jgi:hypothetical protein
MIFTVLLALSAAAFMVVRYMLRHGYSFPMGKGYCVAHGAGSFDGASFT